MAVARYSSQLSDLCHVSPLLARISGERTLARVRSSHNTIRVAERDRRRTLYLVKWGFQYIQSSLNLDYPDSLDLDYARTMTAGFLVRPRVNRLLMLGFGGGLISRYLFQRGIAGEVDAVDLDEAVIHLAREYFLMPQDPRYRTHADDAQAFLKRRSDERWDMIILDAYWPITLPEHLRTREFYALCRSRLATGGAIAVNLHCRNREYRLVKLMIAAVFPYTREFFSDCGLQSCMVAHSEGNIGSGQLREHALELQPKFDFDLTDLAARCQMS